MASDSWDFAQQPLEGVEQYPDWTSQHDIDREAAIEPVGGPEEFGFLVNPTAARFKQPVVCGADV
jgi:hypothetical protein